MKIVRTDLPKLCHSKAGDVIQIVNTLGEVLPACYLVATIPPTKGKRPARIGIPQGLYDDERPFFLVDVETGEAKEMPCFSERIQPLQRAVLITDERKE